MFMPFFQIGLLLTFLVACGGPQASHLDGHYENASASAMNKYQDQQRVPPEFARSQGVIVSQSLLSSYQREDLVKAMLDTGIDKVWIIVSRGSRETLQSSTFSRLRQWLDNDISKVELLPQKDGGALTVWARDWSPLGALDESGDLRLLDLNYYPDRPADDSTGQAFEGLQGVSRVSVPVYNEGGNFMANDRGDCLMTTRVVDANQDIYMSGDIILDAEDISSYYQRFAGCQKVRILPRMPREKTGHIDMWAKFIDNDTIIVGEVSDKTLSYARSSELEFAKNIKRYLDQRAADLEGLDFDVVRIPMPLPKLGLFRSYTNSLFLNGTAIIPKYSESNSDADLVKDYEAEVEGIYSELGFRTKFIESDEMIRSGGAVHCVTMQVPAA